MPRRTDTPSGALAVAVRRPSAERIIPELQEVHVGDFLPMSPDGKVGVWVKDFDPERWLLWWDKKGEMTWLDRPREAPATGAHSRFVR